MMIPFACIADDSYENALTILANSYREFVDRYDIESELDVQQYYYLMGLRDGCDGALDLYQNIKKLNEPLEKNPRSYRK